MRHRPIVNKRELHNGHWILGKFDQELLAPVRMDEPAPAAPDGGCP